MERAPFLPIWPAENAADMNEIRRLFRAYADWLNIDLAYQGFEAELVGLPGKYAPPAGALLLAGDKTDPPVGCVALRPFAQNGWCEMKRLYVAPEGRGLGLGGRLVAAIIDRAKALGYRRMVLDTLPTMAAAIALYERHGFLQIPAYYDTPVTDTVFFALDW
ncbi:N-acetyltransferase [Roseibium aquae]|uniref:N-acetyltransferase n=1 Tax=Roseibium aquae TaxID=1323746 RepID=A0A916TDU0_9HYPH|nr:GNAT family N-acetyltransferase [Roseibium aquae]GGB41407.1 N-acetyltransferase [Roseibium aquae]